MVFDAAVVAELRALCAGAPAGEGEAGAIEGLSDEQVRHHLLRSLEPPPRPDTKSWPPRSGRRRGRCCGRCGGATASRGAPLPGWRWQRSTQKLRWLLMREGGFIAVGGDELGDLSTTPATAEGRAELRARLGKGHGANPQRAARAAAQFYSFVHDVRAGDVVVATDGARSVGIGVVTGVYSYVNDRSLAHRRAVSWLSFDEVPLPSVEPREAFFDITHHDAAILAIEAALLRARVLPAPTPTPGRVAPPEAPPLTGTLAAVEAALRRKGQVILPRAPGTGKTYWAERAALELAARSWFGVGYERLGHDARQQLTELGPGGLGAVESCCFHPSFGYEDFVELQPDPPGPAGLRAPRRPLKRLCRRALLNPGASSSC